MARAAHFASTSEKEPERPEGTARPSKGGFPVLRILAVLCILAALGAVGCLFGPDFVRRFAPSLLPEAPGTASGPSTNQSDAASPSSTAPSDAVEIHDAGDPESAGIDAPDRTSILGIAETQVEATKAASLTVGDTPSGIHYAGRSAIEGSEALEALESIVAECDSRGITLGIVVRSMDGSVELTYNPDARVYSASAIKAPYVFFLAQDLIDTGRISFNRSTIEACVSESDNDAYRTIRGSTRGMGWSSWCARAGLADMGSRAGAFDGYWYALMGAQDLALVWRAGYDYLSAGEGCAEWLAPLLEGTNHSSLHAVLSQRYTVWSKAGWTDGSNPANSGLAATAATNDAGIVFGENGPYVFSVITDAPCDFNLLCRTIDAAHMCYAELDGTDPSPLITEDTAIPVY